MSHYLKALRSVERPSRYLGDEHGLPPVRSDPVRLRVVMGFADVYEVGMSHLGFRLLHASLASREDIRVERVFLPWPDLQSRLVELDLPLSTLESHTPLREFDLLGLSLQYELAIPTVLRLLDLARIPRRTADRVGSGERWPLVLVGGSGAYNPEPLGPFVDCFFVGEADEAIHEIVGCLASHRKAERRVLLEKLSQIEGIYIPELVDVTFPDPTGLAVRTRARPPARLPVRRRTILDLDRLPVPKVHLVPHGPLVHDRVAVEIQRGCSHGCRFCQAGFVARPVRQRGVDRILGVARRQLAQTGYQNLALLSLSAGDHPLLLQILQGLIEEHRCHRVAVSLPSLRTESLCPDMARQIGQVRKTAFTLAPEAATDRLRRVINKGNTEQNLLDAIRTVIRAGYDQLKLYFMIGLPTETDEDVLAIAELADRALREVRAIRKGGRLTVAVSTFVPKPHTPFQWEASLPLEQIRHRHALLLEHLPRRIKLKWHDPGQSLVEAYLSRADRRMATVLERLVGGDGYVGMDAWTDHFSLARWERALDAACRAGEMPAPHQLLAARDPDEPLPWDPVDTGVTRDYLLRQRRQAVAGETRPDCSDGTCDTCGVCPDEPLHRLAQDPPSGLCSPGDAPVSLDSASRELPADAQATTLRLHFAKLGRASLISHLELVRTFERAARRAGLPLAFSRGFSPRPRFRFTPALPLGAESRCELIEIGLQGAMEPAEARARMAEELPPGLVLQHAEPAVGDLLRRIEAVRWRLDLPRPLSVAVRDSLLHVRQRPCRVERKGGKTLDLCEVILELELVDPCTLELTCRFDQTGTVRPAEILEHLLGLDGEGILQTQVTRTGWRFGA